MAASVSSIDRYTIVVAIDFGTTYSGYAFSIKNTKDQIFMNKNWGEHLQCTSYKTPTSVLIGPKKEFISFGYDAIEQYNDFVQENSEGYNLFVNFKMFLYSKDNISTIKPIKSVTAAEMPAFDIFVHLITALKKHFLAAVKKQTAVETPEEMICWVLTVPAIWSDSAKDFMRQVAFKSGLIKVKDSDHLVFAIEPEAAALFCRDEPVKGLDDTSFIVDVAPGGKILVIDAGGGTVDITGYQVLEGGTMREIIVANGGTWGGNSVNENFKELLNEVFGKDLIKEFEQKSPTEHFGMMCIFEKAKKTIKEKMRITVPYGLANLVNKSCGSLETFINNKNIPNVSCRNGALVIKKERACQLFEKTVNIIGNRVSELLNMPEMEGLSYVMLVGGFAESEILQNAIREITGADRLLIPHEAQLAVLKGSVSYISSLPSIKSRVSRRTYGADVMRWFDPSKHDLKRKVTHHKKDWCDGVFEPFVLKGEQIEFGQSVVKRRTPVIDKQKYMTVEIFCTDRTDFTEDVYVEDLETLGYLYIDMPDIKKNFDRVVLVEFSFGGTEMKVTATDESSGNKVNTRLDFC